MEKLLTMNTEERLRNDLMVKLREKSITQAKAAERLGVGLRQIKRLWKAYKNHGTEGLISKKRGKASNRRLPEKTKIEVVELIIKKYLDYGPTLAHEKLTEKHKFKLSVETVRQLMIDHVIWKPHKPSRPVIHQMRPRRGRLGELVQIDGSPHKWFEDRGPECTLLVFIDDATGRLMQLWFAHVEESQAYFDAVKRYVKTHGKPEAFYSDKHGIFRVNIKNALSGTGLTQFGRAMKTLGIEIICANTPQAKGRVERANQTLQDRLIKEMREEGISDMAAANEYASKFIVEFNRKFGKEPRIKLDAHRELEKEINLDRVCCWQEIRYLSKNLTFNYDKVIYQIKTERPSYALRKAAVTVLDRVNGEIKVEYKGKELAYTIYDEQERQGEIVDSKRLQVVLEKRPPIISEKNNRSTRRFPSR